MTQWTSENEGKLRLAVQYLPSEDTKTILYDQDLKIYM